MRTATPETRRALKAAIGDGTQRAWALSHGVNPADVSDALRGHGMSARRENRLRVPLGLEPIRFQMVELAEGQRVVTVTRPRRKVRRAAAMPPELAEIADERAAAAGYRSWGAWAIAATIGDTL